LSRGSRLVQKLSAASATRHITLDRSAIIVIAIIINHLFDKAYVLAYFISDNLFALIKITLFCSNRLLP
jgi:hypothetical protein